MTTARSSMRVEGQALVEERHLLEAARQRREVVVGGLEDVGVGPERDGRAGVVGRLLLRQRGGGHAAQVGLPVHVPIAPDLDVEVGRQRVDDGDADAVQAAGHLVAAAAELAAGVQDGEHDLDGRLALALDDVDRDAATVVDDAHAAVGEQRDDDLAGVAGQRLVDGVVDDLVDQVVQTALAGGADVHAGALADRVQAFENGDRAGVVGHGRRASFTGRRSTA